MVQRFKDPIPGTEVKQLFSCSTQLATKFILLLNVKMPTIVISMKNTTSERLKARNSLCRMGISCKFCDDMVTYIKIKYGAYVTI